MNHNCCAEQVLILEDMPSERDCEWIIPRTIQRPLHLKLMTKLQTDLQFLCKIDCQLDYVFVSPKRNDNCTFNTTSLQFAISKHPVDRVFTKT